MDLEPRRGAEQVLDHAVEQELAADEAGGHDHPRAKPRKEAAHARLAREHGEAVDHGALGPMALVDLRE